MNSKLLKLLLTSDTVENESDKAIVPAEVIENVQFSWTAFLVMGVIVMVVSVGFCSWFGCRKKKVRMQSIKENNHEDSDTDSLPPLPLTPPANDDQVRRQSIVHSTSIALSAISNLDRRLSKPNIEQTLIQ